MLFYFQVSEKPPPSLSSSERREWYREKKRAINRSRVQKHRNKSNERKRECDRFLAKERMKRYIQRKREINSDTNISSESLTNQTPFQNRMHKCRALTTLKDTITPFSPQRRAAILQSLIDSSSPVSKTTRRCLEFKQVVQPSENKTRNKVACALLADVSSSISSAIDKTSPTEKRVSAKQAASFIVGNTIESES